VHSTGRESYQGPAQEMVAGCILAWAIGEFRGQAGIFMSAAWNTTGAGADCQFQISAITN